jgi:4-cresol dehydrogenase (hydroxylating) flavoprotein subunit
LANDFAMLCIVSQYPKHLLLGRTCLSPEAMAQWRREHGVSPWTFGCGVYGTAQEVRSQRRGLRRALRPYGQLWSFGRATRPDWLGRTLFRVSGMAARMTGKSDAFIAQIKPAADLFRGIPTNEFVRQVYFRSEAGKPTGAFDPAKDRCGFIWIGPVVPFTGRDVEIVLAAARDIFERHGFDFFVEVIVESPRALLVLFGVFYERNDPADAARASAWYEALRKRMIDDGYPPYRETAQSFPHVFDANPVARDFLGSIKQAVDPDGLMAPGRYGIGAPRRSNGHDA